MAYTYEASKAGYRNMWNAAQITDTRHGEVIKVAKGIIADRERYEEAARKIGHEEVWPLIGAIHHRESSRSFATHLHNGDSLKGYTYRVPAKRPQVGHGPPFTWEESAEDALRLQGWDKVAEWPIERILYEAERYNGWGYLGRINSPYVWAATSKQQRGKYVGDGVYSQSTWDTQLGVAAILKGIDEIDPSILGIPVSPPPPVEVSSPDKVMNEIIQLVILFIEKNYVILTHDQFAELVRSLRS